MCRQISKKNKKRRAAKRGESVKKLLSSGTSVLSYGSALSNQSRLIRKGKRRLMKRFGKAKDNVSVQDKSDMLSIFDSVYQK